jgi:NAD+ kinase
MRANKGHIHLSWKNIDILSKGSCRSSSTAAEHTSNSRASDPSLRITSCTKAYRNILVVVKQTPYQQYTQLKAQGKAPVALRWERLQNRDQVHTQCVQSVTNILEKMELQYHIIRRDELHRGLIRGKDLIIGIGGDGTILNTSSFIDDSLPLLGVNSDPTRPEEEGVTKVKDERRSRGALCAVKATTVDEILPKILCGEISPGLRSRIQCLVRSTYTETRYTFHSLFLYKSFT